MNRPGRGFTLIEILIAFFALAVFLLPLVRNFNAIRKVTLGARDSVVANSLLASAISDLRSVPFVDLGVAGNATYTRILDKYRGVRLHGQVMYETFITVKPGADDRVKVIAVETEFKIPGATEDATRRRLLLRSFSFAPPD